MKPLEEGSTFPTARVEYRSKEQPQ